MDQWEQLRQQCMSCRACGLADTRTNVVFGVGDPRAEVLLVGEAPGASEDRQGEPFVGAAGKLLDDMLAMIGLRRQQIYITNSVKCRPPQNRDPLNTEKDACSGYLRRQLELMQPKSWCAWAASARRRSSSRTSGSPRSTGSSLKRTACR